MMFWTNETESTRNSWQRLERINSPSCQHIDWRIDLSKWNHWIEPIHQSLCMDLAEAGEI
jgi:hypothetical protein